MFFFFFFLHVHSRVERGGIRTCDLRFKGRGLQLIEQLLGNRTVMFLVHQETLLGSYAIAIRKVGNALLTCL